MGADALPCDAIRCEDILRRALRGRSSCLLDSWLPPFRGEAAADAEVAALRKPRDIVLSAEHHLVARQGVGLAVEDAPS